MGKMEIETPPNFFDFAKTSKMTKLPSQHSKKRGKKRQVTGGGGP